MRRLSEKLTGYVIKAGTVSEELYAVYQYGFQIGLEMLCCLMDCLCIAVYLHMIPEFIEFTGIFMALRTYAGGVHLNSFFACFLCSVMVQTLTLLFCRKYELSIVNAWMLLLISTAFILKAAPVDSVERELDGDEKKHCKGITMKIIIGILVFAMCCTLCGFYHVLSLTASVTFIVLVSQYMGIVKYNTSLQLYK